MQCSRVEIELVPLVQGELEPDLQKKVRAHLQNCPACQEEKASVEALFDLMSVIPPIEVSPDFDDKLDSVEVEAAVSHLERRIKEDFPEVGRVFIEAQSWTAHLREHQRAAGAAAEGE